MLKEISVEITRRCPNYCLHCSSSAHSQCNESMPYETFQTVISDAAKLGTKTICLSGGEPFLHDKIVQMIQFVHSKGMECYVYTSGIAMSPSDQRISLPMEQLRQISGAVTKIIFNIEASTEAIYDRIMGTSNCFSLLKESVLRANAAGICTEAHFVPMALNLREIPAVVRLCEELNISKLSFLRLVLHGRAEQNYTSLRGWYAFFSPLTAGFFPVFGILIRQKTRLRPVEGPRQSTWGGPQYAGEKILHTSVFSAVGARCVPSSALFWDFIRSGRTAARFSQSGPKI